MSTTTRVQPVIVGAEGMLGRQLAEVLVAEHPQTVCAGHDELDITDYWGIRWDLERLQATVVINCAAFTDVDGCESRPDLAQQVNGVGAGNLARACHETEARLIHVSTDFVFDGAEERPYREQAATHPISLYGRSKLEGELEVASAHPDHLILRTSWLYGPHGKNFISAILKAARAGGPLKVVHDQRGTPTYTRDLAEAILRLLSVGARGVMHFANAGVCSRYDFAVEALRLAGMEEVPVESIGSNELDRPARRPANSALDASRYTELTGLTPRPWQETLVDYLEATG